MVDVSVGRAALAVLLGFAFGAAVAAQDRSEPRFDSEDLEPVEVDDGDSALRLRFRLLHEVPLPGPVSRKGPASDGDRIRIDVDGGVAVVSWDGAVEIRPSADPPDAAAPGPVTSPDGKFRCVPEASGWIVAEKRCPSCDRGWRRKWKIRAPGDEFGRPVVTDRRVYYGTTDNQVYCVKRRNGHRVWVRDVAGRVIRPLELARVQAPPDLALRSKTAERMLELILVVPSSGTRMLALDARTGDRVAVFDLSEDESLIGAPVSRDGKVAVARQKYDERAAALLLFGLDPVPGPELPPLPAEPVPPT